MLPPKACLLIAALLLLVAGAPAGAGPAAEPAPPAPTEGQPAAAPAEEEQPAESTRPTLKQGPPLPVVGIHSLEILPRDYEATLRFYVEVLGFKEEEASGGQGERRSTLTAGPLRLLIREQPGQPPLPKRPAWLGIHPAPLGETAAEAAGLKEPKGVLVEDVVPQGPAGAAGLVRGDIILAVEGQETATPEALATAVRTLPIGKKALVTLWRERKKHNLPITLAASPFPDRLAPLAIRLEVRDLDAFYREVLARGGRLYAEPHDTPEGGRRLEVVDPNDTLVILEEPRAGGRPPAEAPPAPNGTVPATQPPAPPQGNEPPQP
ncbi:MAG: PDZ domain-containing protein [Armatimonadetes bacterium]|nr:PDZ domain-containing protein [Armatimonadota bacterium]